MYVGHSESNASYLFPRKLQRIQRAQEHYLMEQILSYGILFFSIATTTSCAFSPAMDKNLHAVLICTSGGDPLSTAETHHPPPHCAHMHRPVSRNVQKASADVIGYPFFHMEELKDTLLLHPHFYGRHHSVTLPLCCHVSQGNRMERNIGGKVQPLLPYHHHSPLTSWANITT